MNLRFFIDHCVPQSVIQTLQSAGADVLVLREHIPTDSDDLAVIAKAQELDAILMSLNGDFADITAYPPSRYKGIIALQVRNHPEVIPSLMRRLTDYLIAHPDMSSYAGRLFLVEAHRIRIRQQA
jgi:predicted nuclease of predicted toxin-antitoxin system